MKDHHGKGPGPVFTMLTIGDRLRYLREVKEINQVTLAKKVGLTQAAISNLETDNSRKPSAPTLLKLAAAFECSPQWILDGKGDPFQYAPITRNSQVQLMKLYESMDDGAKAALLAAAQAMAPK